MTTQQTTFTPIRTVRRELPAETYNTVRLGLLRLGSPLRLALPKLRSVDAILEMERWTCVDRMRGDLPILGWDDFDTVGRASLHLPVCCQMRFFHAHAGLIVGSVLEAIVAAVRHALATRSRRSFS